MVTDTLFILLFLFIMGWLDDIKIGRSHGHVSDWKEVYAIHLGNTIWKQIDGYAMKCKLENSNFSFTQVEESDYIVLSFCL